MPSYSLGNVLYKLQTPELLPELALMLICPITEVRPYIWVTTRNRQSYDNCSFPHLRSVIHSLRPFIHSIQPNHLLKPDVRPSSQIPHMGEYPLNAVYLALA